MANQLLDDHVALLVSLGVKDAEADKITTAFYNGAVDQHTTHLRKHTLAAKQDAGGTSKEADFWIDVLDRVDADPDLKVTTEVADEITKPKV